jgi:hypothetical protein
MYLAILTTSKYQNIVLYMYTEKTKSFLKIGDAEVRYQLTNQKTKSSKPRAGNFSCSKMQV